MTPEEARKIKVGGTIGVRVKRVDSFGFVWIEDAAGEERAFGPPDLLSYTPPEPEPLKVGDRVRATRGGTVWEVVFIEDGQHVHFGVQLDNARFPELLSEVETWERLS